MSDPIDRIRETLAAETRPGEWRVSKYREGRDALIYDADGFEVARVCHPNRDANAGFIAAASPDNIRALLDRLDAAERDAERYRFIRDNPWGPDLIGVIQMQMNGKWDSEIDVAIDAARREK